MLEGLILIENNIKESINSTLKRTGLLYRLFSRIKDTNSIAEKLNRKGYESSGRLMQDVIGFRITTYFNEDVKVLVDYFSSCFEKDSLEYDNPETNEFNPLRKNLVCRMNGENLKDFQLLKQNYKEFKYIDSTFEIQFRTTLSEGWHEVEHNMRYKCKPDWEHLSSQSRILNGIYATLETSDHALTSLFNNIAYQHYKNKHWTGMLRNKYRLRFDLKPLSVELVKIFNCNNQLAKEIFRIERNEIIEKIIYSDIRIKITLNNIVYLCNYLFIKNEDIATLTPSILVDDFKATWTDL